MKDVRERDEDRERERERERETGTNGEERKSECPRPPISTTIASLTSTTDESPPPAAHEDLDVAE